MAPPLSTQSPVVGVRATVAPALSRSPVTLMVPPVRVRCAGVTLAVVNVPPRLSVALLTEIAPALDQVPSVVSVALLVALMNPLAPLIQLVLDCPSRSCAVPADPLA